MWHSNMEELAKRWKKLSLTKIEGNKVDLTSDMKKLDFVLATKFFTRRTLNIEALAKNFHPLWHTKGRFEVSDGGDNVLLFKFELDVDAEKVIQGETWAFDRHLLLSRGMMALSRTMKCSLRRLPFGFKFTTSCYHF